LMKCFGIVPCYSECDDRDGVGETAVKNR